MTQRPSAHPPVAVSAPGTPSAHIPSSASTPINASGSLSISSPGGWVAEILDTSGHSTPTVTGNVAVQLFPGSPISSIGSVTSSLQSTPVNGEIQILGSFETPPATIAANHALHATHIGGLSISDDELPGEGVIISGVLSHSREYDSDEE